MGELPLSTHNLEDITSLHHASFLVPSPRQDGRPALLELFFQVFVDGEGDGLARGDAHDARRDALVEGVHAFLSG